MIACKYEQGDLFYSAGTRTGPKLTQSKGRKRIWVENEAEWTGKVEIRTRNKSLAVRKACMAIF